MFRSIIGLAQDKGSVQIQRTRDDAGAFVYAVTHYSKTGAVLASGVVKYEPDEPAKDTKARALAELRLLAYWPEFRRDLREQRRAQGTGEWSKSVSLPNTPEIVSGLVLPPGFERVR